MDDLTLERMVELKKQGYYCSQILMIMGMDLQGKENPDLIRAMHGLAGGLGFSGETCGALTGGACLLALYAGKGRPADEEHQNTPKGGPFAVVDMIIDLVEWFKNGYGREYGCIRCEDITSGQSQNIATRCPRMVAGTFQKVKELLVENGIDPRSHLRRDKV